MDDSRRNFLKGVGIVIAAAPVAVLDGKPIWYDQRKLNMHGDLNQTGVVVTNKLEPKDLPKKVRNKIRKLIALFTQEQQMEFFGLDVLIKGTDAYFIEVNFSPEFKSMLGVDNNNALGKLVAFLRDKANLLD